MTFQDFLEKWNGKPCDFDGWFMTQCMDLMHQYVYDVLGQTDTRILASSSAKTVYTNFDNIFGHELFDKIDNTPTGMPKEGDIIFWSNGENGHVAICIEATLNKITSFDANYEYTNCHVQQHTYGYCLGWLRYKGNAPDIQIQLNECRLDRDGNHNDRMALYEELGFTGVFNRTVAVEKIRQLLALEKSFVQKDEQLKIANDQMTGLQEKIAKLEKEHADFAAKSTKTIEDQGIEIKSLSRAVQELKVAAETPIITGWRKLVYDFLLNWR